MGLARRWSGAGWLLPKLLSRTVSLGLWFGSRVSLEWLGSDLRLSWAQDACELCHERFSWLICRKSLGIGPTATLLSPSVWRAVAR